MIMGLPFSIHLRGAIKRQADPDAVEAAVEAVWESLRWADRIFSPYRADSEISRIRAGDLRLRDADPAVRQVLDFAEIARRITGGTFDVRGSGSLDPSGIVKGWAASRAAEPLSTLGVDHYLNAGGDVLLRSLTPDRPWRIGIEHPDDPQGLLTVVERATGAVATSGGTHRGAHIWNPATGAPATGIAQATVVGPSLVWADILATAVVAGGLDRLDRSQWPPGHEVLLVTDEGRLLASPGFRGLLAGDVPALPVTVLP
jgi:thiamine biosynthesis lipoprotein